MGGCSKISFNGKSSLIEEDCRDVESISRLSGVESVESDGNFWDGEENKATKKNVTN